MGKAARRKRKDAEAAGVAAPKPAPYAARPFEGLADEAQWVALREIVPAGTAPITVEVDGSSYDVSLATVLPMAWPGLHREDGTRFVALQTGSTSGDASRDLAEAVRAVVALEPGQPLTASPTATADSPRLQDIVTSTSLEVTVHDGFDFWIGDQELDEAGRASMDRANEAVAPTAALSTAGAYWCRIGERCYIRWILEAHEDRATDALARLHAAGTDRLGSGEGAHGRLLGAFRAYGLLVPVWEVDPSAEPAAYDSAMKEVAQRFEQALGVSDSLTPDERRARNGLVSRQVTLR
ncbi:topoisomerase II [Calidifontibacter sp. DB0510]|uniref:Topoisomerase II n=1 Tax=Metallococcus carri TaxID=1656884 RepID=A0A967B9B7_9MICO|nr:DUF5926 family protein [Metallococcus carri]NHN57221.1 topoisomerase II [Metallococcus carri]NOP37976.1 topoisomerase II [Calidifontibacter sp. DB2511S]